MGEEGSEGEVGSEEGEAVETGGDKVESTIQPDEMLQAFRSSSTVSDPCALQANCL